jgi:hypothetical protein
VITTPVLSFEGWQNITMYPLGQRSLVDKFWSVTNHCDVKLPEKSLYRYSTTPLPVKKCETGQSCKPYKWI